MRNPHRLRPALCALVLAGACTATTPVPTRTSGTTAGPTVAPTPTTGNTVRVVPPFPEAQVEAPWTHAITTLIAGRNVSVAVGVGGHIVYLHDGTRPRLPASNEKLLTSMAALSELGPAYRFPTSAKGEASDGIVHGDLWLVGSGNPELGDASLGSLAAAIRADGIHTIKGSVVGDTSVFARGWWAPGWLKGVSREFVTRPTALAIDGNEVSGLPERAAAASLTRALRSMGIAVAGRPRAGAVPANLPTIAHIDSAPLRDILERQNHGSINFDAEMITKALGGREQGPPGSTASGARTIEDWTSDQGVIDTAVYDGSGLSHLDRVSALDFVELLLKAERRSWGDDLRASLPGPGDGTLTGRLAGLPVRAKTGTLFVTPVSALSGYVRSADGRRAAFSVLSQGLDKGTAVAIEDGVVRILAGTRLG